MTITDVASVKGSVVKAVLDIYGNLPVQFVPGHPIAGSEKSGVEAANSQLFKDHRVILTPHNTADCEHLKLVSAVWSSVGAVVSTMSVDEHDSILAATSHLPHFWPILWSIRSLRWAIIGKSFVMPPGFPRFHQNSRQ